MNFVRINVMYKINLMCDNKYLRKQSEHIEIVYRMLLRYLENLTMRVITLA